MGRRLYGIDLDESPFGGLIERLLTEEELEKLADGGRPAGTGEGSDDPDARDDVREATDDVGEATDDVGEATDGEESERSDVTKDSFTWGDTGDGQSAGKSDVDTALSPPHDRSSGVRDRFSTPGAGGYSGTGSYGDAGFEEESDESGGIVSTLLAHKSLLLKASVVLAVLAVVAAVVWKYGGKIKSVLPGRLGGSSNGSDETGESVGTGGTSDTGVSPARRRAKVDSRTEPDEERAPATRPTADAEDGAEEGSDSESPGRERRRPSGDRSLEDVATASDEVDLGALVGLGTLALIAAIVRKFDEERPHDPLVDGPEEE